MGATAEAPVKYAHGRSTLNQQASAMGYQEIYRALCWMSLGMVCCALLLSKSQPGDSAPEGESVH
jgi:DHA2 family multidrug resistance protein